MASALESSSTQFVGRIANPAFLRPDCTSGPRRLWGAAALVGVASLGALLLLAATGAACNYFNDPNGFNSDDLYCSAFCEDVLHGRAMRGWHLPGAPYTFPDVLLLLPCHALFADLGHAFVAYGFLFYLLLLAVLTRVLRGTGLSWRTSLGAAAAGVLFLAAAHLRGPYLGRGLLLFRAGNHAGCFLVGLLLAGSVLHGLRHGFRVPGSAAILLAGSLGGFSDRLLLVQFVSPLLFALVVVGALRLVPVRRAVAAVGLLGLTAGLAFLLRPLFARLGFVLLPAGGDFHWFAAFDPARFVHHFLDGTNGQPLTRAVLVLHLVAGPLLALAWLRRGPEDETELDRPAVLVAVLALWAAPLCNLGAIVCGGMTENPAIDRYSHACFVLPYLTAAAWLSLAPWRAVRAAALPGRLAIAAFAAHLVVLSLPGAGRERFMPRYPPLARALDELVGRHGPLRGIAGFWPARELSFLTHRRVPVRSVADTGAPFPHASSLQAYLFDDPHDLSLPDYHFVLLAPCEGKLVPSPEAVRCEYGEPVEQIEVGDCRIWRYRRLEGRRWELFLRAQLAGRLRREWNYITPSEPETLKRPKENLTRWDRSCHVRVLRGQSLEVRFDHPVTGRLLDVSADWIDQFRLVFYRGEERIATARVPVVWWTGAAYGTPGMQSRLVPLPAACGERAWDRVVMTPLIGHNCATVGHFLVYRQELPYRCTPALTPGQQRRYEAETLPAPDGPSVRLAPNLAASGERVRQAAAGYAGLLSFGPYAFLPPGRYRVDFTLAVGEVVDAPVAVLDVSADCGLTLVRSRELDGTDFPAPGRFCRRSIVFDVAEELDAVEFRVSVTGRTAVSLDCIDLTCLGAAEDGPPPPGMENLYSRSR
jgi:hypothetical protein